MNSLKFIRLIAIALLIICVSACRAQKSSIQHIDAEVQTISLPAFDAIQNQSAVRLHITQGNRQSVQVKQAQAWRLKLSVSRNTLILETQGHPNQQKSAEVWITIPSLKAISNDEALNVDISNFKSKELRINNGGALTLNAGKIDLGTFKFKNEGAITSEISMVCDEVHIDNYGSLKTQFTVTDNNIFNLNNEGCINGNINVSGNTIKIDNDGAMNGDMNLNATTLTIDNDGSGKQEIAFTGNVMDLKNDGAVNVGLTVDCKTLKAKSSGVSCLVISGSADDTQIKSEGVSKIDSIKLNKM